MKSIKDKEVNRPSFKEVYDCLKRYGPATCVSTRGTRYSVRAEITAGRQTIIGCPRTGEVRILGTTAYLPKDEGWRHL